MKFSINWDEIKYFKKTENWGDISKLSPDLVYNLDEFRHLVGKSFMVNNAYTTSGHENKSQHYLGKAVDGYFKGLHWLDQFMLALTYGKFGGVGVYPDWNNPGLHLDVRAKVDGMITTWMRYGGTYMPVTYENISMVLKDTESKTKKASKKESKE